jgi:hypothetical protein
LDQHDRDLLTMARMLMDHQGAKPSLLRIIERYSAAEREREKAAA